MHDQTVRWMNKVAGGIWREQEGVRRGQGGARREQGGSREGAGRSKEQPPFLSLQGVSVREIAERVRLPPHLASHPYLVEYYGTVSHEQ